jgi:Stigma-specific protein, Stig1
MENGLDLLAKVMAGGLTWQAALRQWFRPSYPPDKGGACAFDEMAKALAEGVPRREALRRLGSGLATTLLASLGVERAWAACPPGTTLCGRKCVNLQTDRKNCGSCGHDCQNDQRCVSGSCSGGSGGGGGGDGGGLCANYCSGLPTNQRASCQSACNACGGDTSRLCASNTSGTVACCPQGAPCCSGNCCGVGQQCCLGGNGSAYCTGLGTNQDCSRCGDTCTGGKFCVNQACACANGQIDCGDGICVNLGTNLNCSRCGDTCSGGKFCVGGTCACPSGQADCGTGVCVNLGTNSNCSRCGDACTGGKFCVSGTCTCPSGQADCGDGICVNLGTNSNCSGCGDACTGGRVCNSNRQCVCPSGQEFCSGSCCDGICCSNDVCYAAGSVCCPGVGACPSGKTCCGTTCWDSPCHCCLDTTAEVRPAQGFCYPSFRSVTCCSSEPSLPPCPDPLTDGTGAGDYRCCCGGAIVCDTGSVCWHYGDGNPACTTIQIARSGLPAT